MTTHRIGFIPISHGADLRYKPQVESPRFDTVIVTPYYASPIGIVADAILPWVKDNSIALWYGEPIGFYRLIEGEPCCFDETGFEIGWPVE